MKKVFNGRAVSIEELETRQELSVLVPDDARCGRDRCSGDARCGRDDRCGDEPIEVSGE